VSEGREKRFISSIRNYFDETVTRTVAKICFRKKKGRDARSRASGRRPGRGDPTYPEVNLAIGRPPHRYRGFLQDKPGSRRVGPLPMGPLTFPRRWWGRRARPTEGTLEIHTAVKELKSGRRRISPGCAGRKSQVTQDHRGANLSFRLESPLYRCHKAGRQRPAGLPRQGAPDLMRRPRDRPGFIKGNRSIAPATRVAQAEAGFAAP